MCGRDRGLTAIQSYWCFCMVNTVEYVSMCFMKETRFLHITDQQRVSSNNNNATIHYCRHEGEDITHFVTLWLLPSFLWYSSISPLKSVWQCPLCVQLRKSEFQFVYLYISYLLYYNFYSTFINTVFFVLAAVSLSCCLHSKYDMKRNVQI